MKYLFTTFFATAFALDASAQFAAGPLAGPSISNGTHLQNGQNLTTDLLGGLKAGGIAEYALKKKIYIQSGVMYSMNGYLLNIPGKEILKFKVQSFEIPLTVQVKSRWPGMQRFFAGAGMYASYNTNSFTSVASSPVKTKLVVADTGDIVRFNFGWCINAGYQLPGGLSFRIAYQSGITDLLPKHDDNNSLTMYQASFSIGYLIGNHKDVHKKKTIAEATGE